MSVNIPAEELSTAEAYRLLTSLVVPRPIAWLSTTDASGRGNLAPFSYFQAVCSSPPMISLSFGMLPGGRAKDSLANILETGELTISTVSRAHAETMNATSVALERGHSEWEHLGIAAEASNCVRPPRVQGCAAALEARLVHALPVGRGRRGGPSATLVLAEIVSLWLSKTPSRDEKGRYKPLASEHLDSVGRMAGMAYTTTRDTFELARPAAPPAPSRGGGQAPSNKAKSSR